MSSAPDQPSLRQRLFARMMSGADEESFEMYRERKARLLSPLRGTVVEIGPGTGVNLQFLDPGVRWIGLEPNPAMQNALRDKANKLGRTIDLRSEHLDRAGIPPGSVDAVISTLVLCSVPSMARVLAQVLEVLKPGGSFVFIEHVADRPRTLRRLVQKTAWYTPWRYFSDGCNPGRDTADSIREAGFSRVECESYMQHGSGLILMINRPHISGTAIK